MTMNWLFLFIYFNTMKYIRIFLQLFIYFVIVGSQIVAHTQMETGDGPNKPNKINL